MKTKLKQFGFTLAEMITVMAIIAILIGLLVPTLSWVHKIAKKTKQKVQFTNINFGLETFKNDYGSYPPSDGWNYASMSGLDYCGTQKLAEALLGWDLLGFHPRSAWRADGLDRIGEPLYYDLITEESIALDRRRGPYLKFAITNIFKLGDLFDDTDILVDTFVLCDVFGVKKITVGTRTITAGTPILYYRANISSKSLAETGPLRGDGIYDSRDNSFLINLGKMGDVTMPHPLLNRDVFYEYIKNPTINSASGIPWPYRSDSYILISAGVDGKYGTVDDITNFGN